MATRKKKIEISEISELPKIVKGSHLTVTTYSDGRTELEWDDEQLLKEVREALATVTTVEEVKPKRKGKK